MRPCLLLAALTLPPALAAEPAPRPHWAFQPPPRPTPPAVRDREWVRTPVDMFILARLDKAGLRPAPPGRAAGRRRLQPLRPGPPGRRQRRCRRRPPGGADRNGLRRRRRLPGPDGGVRPLPRPQVRPYPPGRLLPPGGVLQRRPAARG